jgi:phage baseplate assembly protein W
MKAIAVPFSFFDGKVQTISDIEKLVKQEIIDFFSTSAGQRIRHYRYGGNIQALAFELLDKLALADYKVDALTEVNRHLTRGKVIDIAVTPSNDLPGGFDEENTLVLSIKFAVTAARVSTVKLLIQGTILTEESDL